MKLAIITASIKLLLVVTTAAPTLAVKVNRSLQRTENPPRPQGRFVAWSQLSFAARDAATNQLDFTEEQWNDPHVRADVEELDYESLTAAQMAGVATAMGISVNGEDAVEIWDCWINHYENYDWEELGPRDANVQTWWEVLGWTEAAWDDGEGETITSDMIWVDLTPEQRAAAEFLCYDQNEWDGVNFESLLTDPPTGAPSAGTPSTLPTQVFTSLPTSPPTATPTSPPTDHPTIFLEPSTAPTTVPSTMPSTSHMPTSSPSTSVLPTSVPSTSPSGTPTSSPTGHPTTSLEPSLHPTASSEPTTVPSTMPTTTHMPTSPPSTSVPPTAGSTSFPSEIPTIVPTDNLTTSLRNHHSSRRYGSPVTLVPSLADSSAVHPSLGGSGVTIMMTLIVALVFI